MLSSFLFTCDLRTRRLRPENARYRVQLGLYAIILSSSLFIRRFCRNLPLRKGTRKQKARRETLYIFFFLAPQGAPGVWPTPRVLPKNRTGHTSQNPLFLKTQLLFQLV